MLLVTPVVSLPQHFRMWAVKTSVWLFTDKCTLINSISRRPNIRGRTNWKVHVENRDNRSIEWLKTSCEYTLGWQMCGEMPHCLSLHSDLEKCLSISGHVSQRLFVRKKMWKHELCVQGRLKWNTSSHSLLAYWLKSVCVVRDNSFLTAHTHVWVSCHRPALYLYV